MKTFLTVAAVTAAAFVALPAAAADLHVSSENNPVVRIQVAGKTADVLTAEIASAADAVCSARADGDLATCVKLAVRDANQQLKAINRAHQSPSERIEVARTDPTTVKISLKGKSPAQIDLDIKVAAQSVCAAAVGRSKGTDFAGCVSTAVRDAKTRLAQVVPARQLASN